LIPLALVVAAAAPSLYAAAAAAGQAFPAPLPAEAEVPAMSWKRHENGTPPPRARPPALAELGPPQPPPGLSPLEGFADPLATDLVLIGFGTAADLASTDLALHNCGTCREGNPLAPRVEGRVALKTAGAFFRAGVAYYLRRHGHGRAADVFRWAGLAVDTALTVNNLRLATN
jgi:hypothetical protein